MKSLKFEISNTGKVKVIDSCGWGSGCLEATKDIEAKLGKVDESTRQLTEKYNEKTIDNVVSVEAH